MKPTRLLLRTLLTLALVACAPEDSGGLGSGGGSLGGNGGGSGVDDDGSQQGEEAPYINAVSAGFETTDEWIIRFELDFDYSKDINGGTVELDITEEGGERQSFDLVVGGQYAPIDDGNIVFAVQDVTRTKSYAYTVLLSSPEETRSEPWEGRVEAIAR
jgi:hypothetical protein